MEKDRNKNPLLHALCWFGQENLSGNGWDKKQKAKHILEQNAGFLGQSDYNNVYLFKGGVVVKKINKYRPLDFNIKLYSTTKQGLEELAGALGGKIMEAYVSNFSRCF